MFKRTNVAIIKAFQFKANSTSYLCYRDNSSKIGMDGGGGGGVLGSVNVL